MAAGKGMTVRKWAVGLALAATFLCGHAVCGVELKSGENVMIDAGETIRDDLYMTGDTMTVRGRVLGDVVAAGRMITIEGVVEGDLIAAAQAIVIAGEITDDVRIAGMTLQLGPEARIGDDAFAGGFSFESQPGSRVAGKTGLTGFQAVLGGDHGQGLEASLVGLRIEGWVQGDVDATVESEAGPAWWTRFMRSPVPLPVVEPGLVVTEDARVEGDIRYQSTAAAEIAAGSTVDGVIEQAIPKVAPEPQPTVASRLTTAVRWLLVLLLLGSTLLWLFPDKILGIAETLVDRPAASLGWGFVTLLGFPVAMILLLVLTAVLSMAFGMLSLGPAVALILVVGLLTELALAAKLWVAAFYLAPTLVSFAGGRWLLTRKESGRKGRYLSLLVGLVVLTALVLIPFVGPLVRASVVLLGIGAGSLWSVRYLARTDPT